jgi:hypothetical protein
MKSSSILLLFIALSLALIPNEAYANKAALVVRKSTGEIKTACVEFTQEYISGEDLLNASGFKPVFENKFLVEIDLERSNSSANLSDDDLYWSYWIFSNGWKYANSGASYTKVYDGNIQGWQLAHSTILLPNPNFDDICAHAIMTATKTPTITDNSGKRIVEAAPAVGVDGSTGSKPNINTNGTETAVRTSAPAIQENVNGNQQRNDEDVSNGVKIKNEILKTLDTIEANSSQKNYLKLSTGNVLILAVAFFLLALIIFWIKFFIHKYRRSHLK